MREKIYYCTICGKEQIKTVPERFSQGCSYCKAAWPLLSSSKLSKITKLKIEINERRKKCAQ